MGQKRQPYSNQEGREAETSKLLTMGQTELQDLEFSMLGYQSCFGPVFSYFGPFLHFGMTKGGSCHVCSKYVIWFLALQRAAIKRLL